MYGSEVWSADYSINLNNIDPLPKEKLYHKFCKSVLGINRNLSSPCKMGRTPVVYFTIKLIFSYYEKLKTLPSNRVLVKAFKTGQDLHVNGGKVVVLLLGENFGFSWCKRK